MGDFRAVAWVLFLYTEKSKLDLFLRDLVFQRVEKKSFSGFCAFHFYRQDCLALYSDARARSVSFSIAIGRVRPRQG